MHRTNYLSYNGNNASFSTTSDSGKLHGLKGYLGADTGDYVVKLNYVDGSGVTTAVVTVNAGPAFYKTAITLDLVAGAAGNDNPPYSVCTIIVAQSGSSYLFKITPAT